jgi:hypothetical protein
MLIILMNYIVDPSALCNNACHCWSFCSLSYTACQCSPICSLTCCLSVAIAILLLLVLFCLSVFTHVFYDLLPVSSHCHSSAPCPSACHCSPICSLTCCLSVSTFQWHLLLVLMSVGNHPLWLSCSLSVANAIFCSLFYCLSPNTPMLLDLLTVWRCCFVIIPDCVHVFAPCADACQCLSLWPWVDPDPQGSALILVGWIRYGNESPDPVSRWEALTKKRKSAEMYYF